MVDALGYYTLLEEIGAGALGVVYRARDTRLGRTVAIKLVPAEIAQDPDQRTRLLTVARQATRLSHPSIASLSEIGEDDEHLFLVLEYAAGETLRSEIAGRAMNVRRALTIAAEVADALAEGHRLGVVHGDIRPENVILTATGRAKVLDFGLTPFTAGGRARSGAGRDAGKAAAVAPYLSPEQALGAGTDFRTDIFSLGCVLYEMLTGQSPFRAADAGTIAVKVMQYTPPPPSSVNAQVPVELDEIVRRALSKSLEGRIENAAGFAASLRALAADLEFDASARDDAEGAPAWRARRPWSRVLIGAALVAAGIGWLRACV